eukprot:TRINITY_DN2558_c0_g1_i4.p2 TRINITY_DN2558_c0_g1~~TRINITY_DN2558_c0_g1_i4.p2  ORF type:complete len:255 (-),score=82.24 TRINITY_DN2558_c0_g1_i4:1012-1776(-)
MDETEGGNFITALYAKDETTNNKDSKVSKWDGAIATHWIPYLQRPVSEKEEIWTIFQEAERVQRWKLAVKKLSYPDILAKFPRKEKAEMHSQFYTTLRKMISLAMESNSSAKSTFREAVYECARQISATHSHTEILPSQEQNKVVSQYFLDQQQNADAEQSEKKVRIKEPPLSDEKFQEQLLLLQSKKKLSVELVEQIKQLRHEAQRYDEKELVKGIPKNIIPTFYRVVATAEQQLSGLPLDFFPYFGFSPTCP